ncbi:bifunctional demethylmenaquinone methyltransferase/2-methoxy-6-polyprenyl-1,4-benzoquinol methylase UbiE [Actinobaculum suis]|nr:bifunctional demethylmenaquinone methyltransferase/2-methoxy-6-polyprenyl-1,4-benzoquinol methylase UbiE [Actinobaculum suis]MDY5152950.1 bifunctional demethylmenaquinone methyltransferase/2-methoxy-6-polyprenyl-1,4-benzoquinol methylase UbiE [Actinobaculum suis]
MGKRADLSKKPVEVSTMFDQVAPRYDAVNTLLTAGQVHVWREAIAQALDISAGMRILDIATGTGTSAASYARLGAEVTGVDFSQGMLEIARTRHPGITFQWADATNLPQPDNSFDAVTISYGLRNIADPQAALREMLRVARPGGTLAIIEFSHPSSKLLRFPYRTYLKYVLPKVAALAGSDGPAYAYLMESILAWPNQQELGRWIQEAGWRQVEYRNVTGGIVAIHRARKPVAA